MSSMTSLLTASRETSRLHRWTMWRMTVNEGIITCIRDQGTSRVLFPDPTGAATHPDSQSLTESVSRDPMRHFPFVSPEEMSMARKMNLRDYYGSGHGLSEDSYFIFGLPRISNYNKDVPDVTSQGTHSAYGSVNDLRHALGQDPAATSTDRRQTNPAAYNLLTVNTGTNNGNTQGREVNPTYAEVRLGQDYRAPALSNINMGTDSHNTTNGYRYQEINGNRPRENDEQFQSAWSRQGPSMDRGLGDHDPSQWPKPALPPQSRSPPVVPRLDLYSIQEEFDNNRNTSRSNRDQPPQQRYRESTKANGYDPNQLYSNSEINRLSKPYSGYEMHRLNSTNGDASERYASARHGNTMDAPSRFSNNMDAPSRFNNNMDASTRFSNNADASMGYDSNNVDPARHSYAESGRYENVAQHGRYENVARDGRYGNVAQDGRYGNVAQDGRYENVAQDGRYGNVAQNGRYENTAQHGFPASHEREDATYSSPHYRKTTPPPVSPKPANYQPFFAPGPAPHLSVKQQAEAYTRQLSQAEAHPRTQSQSDVHGRSQYDVNPRSQSEVHPRSQPQSDVYSRPQSESYTRQAEPYPRPRSEVYPPFSPNRPGYSPSAKASPRQSFFPPSENHEPGYLAGRHGHATPPPAPDRMRTGMYEGQKAPRPTSLLGGGRRSPDDAERIEREKRQAYYDWSTPTVEKYVFSDFTTSNYNRFS